MAALYFPLKMELSFYFFFEYANSGSLASLRLIYHSVKSRLPLLAHYFSRAAFPHYENAPRGGHLSKDEDLG